jgi:hypothetical protein
MRYLAVNRRWMHDYALTADIVGRSHRRLSGIPSVGRNPPPLLGGCSESRGRSLQRATVDSVAEVEINGGRRGAIGRIIILVEDITESRRRASRY